jgi:hypothetical protein
MPVKLSSILFIESIDRWEQEQERHIHEGDKDREPSEAGVRHTALTPDADLICPPFPFLAPLPLPSTYPSLKFA